MLSDFKIFRYPFMDAVAGKKFSTHGYNYMDIVTDGAINPAVNYPGGAFEEDLYIEFENEDKLLINQEVSNFLIRRYDRAKMWYQPYSQEHATVQGGFGNLYVILKKYKTTVFDPPKENPYVSFREEVVNVGGAGDVSKWLGKNRMVSTYALKIPYIPPKYSNIQYICESNATTWNIKLKAYQIDDNNNADTLLIDLSANAQSEIKSYSTRYDLLLHNRDSDTTKSFYIQLLWIK